MKTETRSGYAVSGEMKALWAVGLDLLERFMAVCDAHHLQYCAVYGTLLGAVRHGGFIPWDDDIDVAMPRADYDKLAALGGQAFEPPYFLQTPENDPEVFNGILRLRNSNTTFCNTWDLRRRFNKGCYIDILPLDGVAGSPMARWRQERALQQVRRQLTIQTVYGDSDPAHGYSEEARQRATLARGMSHQSLCRKFDALSRQYTGPDARLWTVGGSKRILLPREAFEATLPMAFEHLEIPVPIGYEDFIAAAYGSADMPENDERAPTHKADIIDTETPYRHYDRRWLDVFDGAGEAPIYLFGAGHMAGTYMQVHGAKYPPTCLVDNDPGKWGRQAHGIEVRPPAELPGLLAAEGGRVIICNIYHEEISAQLEEMGIEDYYIYTEGKLYGEV